MNVNVFQSLRDFVERLGDGVQVRGYMKSLLKREFYMETFQIDNLDNPAKPLALVTTNPREGLYPLWPWFQKARRFTLYEMGKDTALNCSLFEFLDNPTWVVDGLLEEYAEKHLRRIRAAEAAAAEAKRLGKQTSSEGRPFNDIDSFLN